MKTFSILGCGWYGKPLGAALLKDGFTVKGSTTSAEKLSHLADIGIEPYIVNLGVENQTHDPAFFNCDLLIISIPPTIRNTGSDDFLIKMQLLISLIKKYDVPQVIFISSTGVYGENQGIVDELTTPLPDTPSGNALYEIEKLMQQQKAFTTTIIRFGGLGGPNRHPGRFFAGKKDIPNGQSPVNLIHLDDTIGLTRAIIEKAAYGHVFNACSPDHPIKADFYRMATQHYGAQLPEFKNELICSKQVNCLNAFNLLNYRFKVRDWMDLYSG